MTNQCNIASLPEQPITHVTVSVTSRRRTDRSHVKRQQRNSRRSSTAALLLLLAVICTQQKQDHLPQQYIFVAAFSVIVNHQRSNCRILTLLQQKDQNKNDDDSPLFYNDFDGFNSDDIYVTNAKDKTKAADQAMDSDDDSDEDDDSENDSIVNENSLGDWRSFRRKLATQERQGSANKSMSSSSSTTDTANESLEQSEQLEQNPSLLSASNDNKKGMTTATIKKTKTPNELLFEQQNDKLAQEYYHDSWAHEIATVCIFLTCSRSLFCSARDHLADIHLFLNSTNYGVSSPK